MRKSRNRKKTKQQISSDYLQFANAGLTKNMSSEEIRHIIANAIIEADEIKAQREEEKRKAALKEWHSIIGYQKCDTRIKQFFNYVKVFIKMLSLSKKHIKEDRVSIAILKSIVTSFFIIIQCGLLIILIGLIAYIFALIFALCNSFELVWYQPLLLAIFGIIIFVIYRLFRLVRFEIDNLNDRDCLFNLIASITSIVSIIIAVIAVVKGG